MKLVLKKTGIKENGETRLDFQGCLDQLLDKRWGVSLAEIFQSQMETLVKFGSPTYFASCILDLESMMFFVSMLCDVFGVQVVVSKLFFFSFRNLGKIPSHF